MLLSLGTHANFCAKKKQEMPNNSQPAIKNVNKLGKYYSRNGQKL